MMRCLFAVTSLFVAAMLNCCQSQHEPRPPEPSHVLRIHFPKIDVGGAYADRMTVDDVRQIRDAARNRNDINLPISIIYADTPDCVRVVTEDSRVVNRKFFEIEFTVDKKMGIWMIDARSIKKQQGSISSEEDERDPNAIIVD